MDQAVLADLVVEVVRDYNELEDREVVRLDGDGDGPLFGAGSDLDSLGLVTIIADIEDAISNRFGFEVVLTDDAAMSAGRSPFATVRSLLDFVISRAMDLREAHV